MQDFKNLLVWQKNHKLTLDIYRSTSPFPREEMYGLTSQMRRAAVSTGSNIAEGCCREGGADFARFLQIALGSSGELENQILVAADLEFMERDVERQLTGQVTEIKRMLTSLIQKIRAAT